MANDEKKVEYSDSSIQVLEGLEAVRKRPGMYISSTDGRGLHHLIWEIVDNSIDEALQGHGSEIKVTINDDNSITVEDSGRGVPCGIHPSGRNTMEIIYTVLHAGGKFGGGESGYKVSSGLHGVGSSVVNALSSHMEVISHREGKMHKITFSKGGKNISQVEVIGETDRTGTTVTFKPDATIFSTTLINYNTVKERLRESAFLIKNLRMTVIDKRTDKEESFFYENGISEYVSLINEGKTPLHDVAFFTGNADKIQVEVAMQFIDEYSESLVSFVNNVKTKDGGTHEIGYRSAVTKAFNEYARKNALIKEKDPNLDGSDLRCGLTTIISVRIEEDILEFESQTKGKLGTPAAKDAVNSVLYEKLTYHLMENPNLASNIIQKAVKEALAREAARKARTQARVERKDRSEVNLAGKFSPAQTRNSKVNELFIVEGDSAGGSAKQGRDRRFQAILPLRGKVLNTEKKTADAALANNEIAAMLHVIGSDYGDNCDPNKCNFNKIILMTDADDDGAHIQVLLLTFFFRYMRPLIEAGKVYIALPPFFKLTKKGTKNDITYAWSQDEMKELTSKSANKYIIQRFKGLGEMNSDQLWETTMNPESRNLIQVTIDELADAESQVDILMGDDAPRRRAWLENNVEFSLVEDSIE